MYSRPVNIDQKVDREMTDYKFWITLEKDNIDLKDIEIARCKFEDMNLSINEKQIGILLTYSQFTSLYEDLSRFEMNFMQLHNFDGTNNRMVLGMQLRILTDEFRLKR